MKYSFVTLLMSCVMAATSCSVAQNITESQRIEFAKRQLEKTGEQRNFIHSVKEDSVVIIEGYFLKPGGTLYYVSNDNGWGLKQTLDLTSIMGEFSPNTVVHNDDWLCVEALPKIPQDKQKLFFFKKCDDSSSWVYVDYPNSVTCREFISQIRLLDNNQLIYEDREHDEDELKHNLSFYDLNESPPKLVQKILPDQSRERIRGSFVADFVVCHDMLVVMDSYGLYTPDEFSKYGLTKYDLPEGKNELFRVFSPSLKQQFLVYRFENGEWKYQTDIYDHLPHPPGQALREKKQYKTSEGFYSKLLDFRRIGALHDNMIWLFTNDEIYVLQYDESTNHWQFLGNFTEERWIRIGKNYSVQFSHENRFDIFKTNHLEHKDVLWSSPYSNPESYSARKLLDRDALKDNPIYSSAISGKTLYINYRYFDAYVPQGKLKNIPVWAGVSVFEINESTGPKEVFRMEACNNNNLEVKPIENN